LCDGTNVAVGCYTYYSGCCCYSSCVLNMCFDDADVWSAEEIPCVDAGGVGVCMAEEDMGVLAVDCVVGEPCMTASGYENGVCLEDSGNFYCTRGCELAVDPGCELDHTCVALVDSDTGDYYGGVCFSM
jgi:hypothetical protein